MVRKRHSCPIRSFEILHPICHAPRMVGMIQAASGKAVITPRYRCPKDWRIPQGSPSSPWEGVSKFHYPPHCHRARFAKPGLRLRRSLEWLVRNHFLKAIVLAAHLMSLSCGFCACIMVYSVFNVQRKGSWRMSLHLSSF